MVDVIGLFVVLILAMAYTEIRMRGQFAEVYSYLKKYASAIRCLQGNCDDDPKQKARS